MTDKFVIATLLGLGLFLGAPRAVQAQPTVDGQTTDSEYALLGTSPAEQPSSPSPPPYIGGVISLSAHAGPNSLYVAVEGKVRNNYDGVTREMVLFINSSAVDGVDSGTPLPVGSADGSPFAYIDNMRLDMDADFGIRLTGDVDNTWAFASIADYAGYVAGDSTDSGKVKDSFEKTLKSLDGTPETGDATGGTYAYVDADSIEAVDGTGFEFSLPHDALGTSQSDEFQFFVFYGDGTTSKVSATLIPDDGEPYMYKDGFSKDWTLARPGAPVPPWPASR